MKTRFNLGRAISSGLKRNPKANYILFFICSILFAAASFFAVPWVVGIMQAGGAEAVAVAFLLVPLAAIIYICGAVFNIYCLIYSVIKIKALWYQLLIHLTITGFYVFIIFYSF